MSHDIGWNFPSNGGGQVSGFNDSGIETFAGNPFESLAREIIQNSLDARARKDEAVVVRFQFQEICSEKFPGHEEMLDIVDKCLDASQDDLKGKEFFENAKKILTGKSINCLKILDSNTTGLQGDRKKGDWHRLTKATGKPQTEKNAGGSFGIGKNAPFAVSDLRTVFYSTRYGANGKDAEYAQGKAILVSHAESNGGETQAVGFYGVREHCDRLADKAIPSILKREKDEKDGTTVFVPALREVKGWEEKIVAAITSNFFFSINEKELVVNVESTDINLVIDHTSLPNFLGYTQVQDGGNKAMQKLLHALWNDSDVQTARAYYHAIKEARRVDAQNTHLGHCVLWISQTADFPKKVAVIRRGMKITDRLPRLQRGWGGCADFAAVCVCQSDAGNQLLRRMENPAHNAFEPERLGKKSNEGQKALWQLAEWIKIEVKKIAEESIDEPVPLDRMSEFFPSEDDELGGENSERDFGGRASITLRPQRKPPTPVIDFDDDDSENGGDEDDHQKNGGGKRVSTTMSIESVRILSGKNANTKRVKFTPKQSGKGALSLHIAGDSFTEKVGIKRIKGTGAKKTKGQFVLDVQEGKRVGVEVELFEPISESLFVQLAKVKK